MKLWPPSSEMMEFLISSYCIVQLTSGKFCTLIKDENRDFLIFFPPWSSNTSTVMGHGHLKVKMRVFSCQLTYCSTTSVQLYALIKFKEVF